jgi:predicted lipoprotein with Yx(FWY)xxD motif
MRIFNGRRVSALAALALAGVLALAACATATGGGGGAYGGAYGGSSSSNSSSSSVQLTCTSSAMVCTKSVQVSGQAKTVLATTSGMTLYYFTPDTSTEIACSASCAQTWPPLTATGSSVTGSSLSGTLSTFNGPNGDQVLYNGHPLYTYSGDHAQSDANGEGVLGKWYAATPDLPAATAPSASPTSGGYGSGY